ncbi:MAG: adenosylcobinamide-phosphate synthase CbiB [Clostridia bacterium]|nr:adenosylcobinamide-phosphate synthase CbiB [Clostridia bacterium]
MWLAVLLDWAIGDPRWRVHPVRLMGQVIAALERPARFVGRRPWSLRLAGGLTVAVVVGGSYLLPWWFLQWLMSRHSWLALVLEATLIAGAVAARSLGEAATAVYQRLAAGDLPGARIAVSELVARDTEHLTPEEVVRAAVETVAENTVDGVTAPFFYALLGGAPLALAYRAVNTLDSMWGYRDERYRDLGWCAAKLDDLANYLPARLTGLLLCLLAGLGGFSGKRAWEVLRRDARRHPSPNSGFPEAAVAGALGIRLGGVNRYRGKEEFRPYLGEPLEPPDKAHILKAVRLMCRTALCFPAAGTALLLLFR